MRKTIQVTEDVKEQVVFYKKTLNFKNESDLLEFAIFMLKSQSTETTVNELRLFNEIRRSRKDLL